MARFQGNTVVTLRCDTYSCKSLLLSDDDFFTEENNDDKLITHTSLKVTGEGSIEIFATKTKLCMSAQQCMCQTN